MFRKVYLCVLIISLVLIISRFDIVASTRLDNITTSGLLNVNDKFSYSSSDIVYIAKEIEQLEETYKKV